MLIVINYSDEHWTSGHLKMSKSLDIELLNYLVSPKRHIRRTNAVSKATRRPNAMHPARTRGSFTSSNLCLRRKSCLGKLDVVGEVSTYLIDLIGYRLKLVGLKIGIVNSNKYYSNICSPMTHAHPWNQEMHVHHSIHPKLCLVLETHLKKGVNGNRHPWWNKDVWSQQIVRCIEPFAASVASDSPCPLLLAQERSSETEERDGLVLW